MSTAWHRRQRPDPKRTQITCEEVYRKLRQIENCRANMEHAWLDFADWLDGSPELANLWGAFTRAGGLTANDFAHFLCDRKFRHHAVRQHGHLRLITAHEPTKPTLPRRRLRRRNRNSAA
jgi:hypothetical protein